MNIKIYKEIIQHILLIRILISRKKSMIFQIATILQNTFSLIFILITIVVGIKILSKYFIYKDPNFLFVGIAWIGMAFPYIPEVISTFILLLDLQVNPDVLFLIYVLVNIVLIPIFFIFWLIAFTNLLQLKTRNKLVIIVLSLILSAIFEVLILYLYIFDVEAIGLLSGLYLAEWTLFINIILVILLSIILTTGLLFACASMKVKEPEIVVKGRFLLFAFLIYAIGALIDAFFTDFLTNIISRVILVFGSILFYFGFILPSFLKNYLVKSS